VLELFAWLTNLGALGVLALMTVTSFAVVAFFRRTPDREAGQWRTQIAPAVAGMLMIVVLVLGVTNFNVLITSATDAPLDTMAVVLPLLLVLAGVAGMVVAAAIRARDPERYARIGERTAVEQAEHVGGPPEAQRHPAARQQQHAAGAGHGREQLLDGEARDVGEHDHAMSPAERRACSLVAATFSSRRPCHGSSGDSYSSCRRHHSYGRVWG
jgi:hypothetical protein